MMVRQEQTNKVLKDQKNFDDSLQLLINQVLNYRNLISHYHFVNFKTPTGKQQKTTNGKAIQAIEAPKKRLPWIDGYKLS